MPYADGQLSGMAQLLFRHADGVGHVAAVLVDHLHILLGHGGRAVQDDREARQTAGDLFEDVEAEGRRNENAVGIAGALLRLELISAVAGADGDGQRVDAGLGDEFLDLFRTGVGADCVADLVLDAGQGAELAFDDDAVVMGILDDLAGQGDVVLEAVGGAVDHDGGEAAVDAALAGLEVGAVIQMQDDGDIRVLDDGSLDQLHQIGVVGIGARALGNLQDDGGLQLAAGLGDALHDLHVVDVEGADGVAAGIGLLEHLGTGNESHCENTPFLYFRQCGQWKGRMPLSLRGTVFSSRKCAAAEFYR